ncbi:MAG: NADH-ubiquinone oxidoreductase chain K, partial [uncultured Nocardioidaceae bacterium]
APVVAAAAGEPALRDRGVRRARAPQRGAGADGRRADAERGQHQPGRLRRTPSRRTARRPDLRPVHHRHRGGRGGTGPRDRAAGLSQPRPHRRRPAARARGPRPPHRAFGWRRGHGPLSAHRTGAYPV